LDLSRVLEPLLVFRRLHPALVRLAGADQIHVGAQILAVLARLVARAVWPETEVSGCKLLRCVDRPVEEVSALKTNGPFDRTRVALLPEPIPVGESIPRFGLRVLDAPIVNPMLHPARVVRIHIALFAQ